MARREWLTNLIRGYQLLTQFFRSGFRHTHTGFYLLHKHSVRSVGVAYSGE